MNEKTHESADAMAKELLQHPIGDQTEILKQFKAVVLNARMNDADNKKTEADNYQKFLDEIKEAFVNP